MSVAAPWEGGGRALLRVARYGNGVAHARWIDGPLAGHEATICRDALAAMSPRSRSGEELLE